MNMEKNASMIMSLNPPKIKQKNKRSTNTHKIVNTVMTISMIINMTIKMNMAMNMNTVMATVMKVTTMEVKMKASE